MAGRGTEKAKKSWREIRDQATMASVGLEIGLAILVGWYVGHLFDGEFQTAPWGQLFFMLAGIGAAGKAVLRAVKTARVVMMRPEPGQAEAQRMDAVGAARVSAYPSEGASR